MRHASMAMSWLAERNATSAAAAIEAMGEAAGLVSASSAAAAASAGWIAASQPRRRPSRRSGPGGAIWSNTGDHRNFSEYASPMLAVRPITASVTPLSDSQ